MHRPGFINRSVFRKVMRAWNAFSASDISEENGLDFNFLVYVIAAYDDEMPDDIRLEKDKNYFEKVNRNLIERKEWVKYVFFDKFNSGKCIFRRRLRRLFKKTDREQTGVLNKQQLSSMFVLALEKHIKKIQVLNKKNHEHLSGVIGQLGQEMLNFLNKGQLSGQNEIDWISFRGFMESYFHNSSKIMDFLSNYWSYVNPFFNPCRNVLLKSRNLLFSIWVVFSVSPFIYEVVNVL